jgi:hypothetical protein
MRTRRSCLALGSVLLLVLGASRGALAHTHDAELCAAGTNEGGSSLWGLRGSFAYVFGEGTPKHWTGLVDSSHTAGFTDNDEPRKRFTFLIGGRRQWFEGTAQPFVQLLAGLERTTTGTTSKNSFSAAGGGGVDLLVPAMHGVAVRFQVDFLTPLDDFDLQPRYTVALVVRVDTTP